jgi:hypothetical protein
MGVLDDAIREHLELKRQHGAPEEELRRQEEEALGPVRREVAPPEETEALGDGETSAEVLGTAAEEAGEPAPASGAVAPFDGETHPQQHEPRADEPELEPFAEEAAPAVPHPAEPVEPLPDPEEPEGAAKSESGGSEPRAEPGLDQPPEGSRRFERETYPAEGEPDVSGTEEPEAVLDEKPEGESEETGDVLEDTPDFLEETPEHDRLWFEQRPPRDFDFD